MNPKPYLSQLAACLLLSILLSACGGQIDTPTPQPATATTEPIPTSTPKPTATPEPSPTPTNPPSPTPEISAEMEAEMAEIQAQISEMRGLAAGEGLQVEVYDTQELEQYLEAKLRQEYTEDEEFQELVTLAYLGLIPPTFELRDFYQDMYAEQLLGFYDLEKNEMVLIQGVEFDALGRMIFAHEYVHAMKDRAVDIDGRLGLNNESCAQQADRCAALQALIEGDATLASALWMLANTTPQEQAEIAAAGQAATPVLTNAPTVFQEDLSFPYSVGVAFVQYLFQQGGWGAVDQAYLNPPQSTEQVMHPESYPADLPLEVSLPDLLPVLGEGWELLDQGIMGEWRTLLLLTSNIDPQARQEVGAALPAVTGWGGDAYSLYYNLDSGQAVLVLKTQWDTAEDAAEFYAALEAHILARFDLAESESELIEMFQYMQLGYAQYQLLEDTTYYILSPSEEVSAAVLEAATGD